MKVNQARRARGPDLHKYDQVGAQCPICLRAVSLVVKLHPGAEAGYVFEGGCLECALLLRLHVAEGARELLPPIVPDPPNGEESSMSSSLLGDGRRQEPRLITRGCPRCKGALERCEDKGRDGSLESYWHCINCGRSYDIGLFFSVLPAEKPARTKSHANVA